MSSSSRMTFDVANDSEPFLIMGRVKMILSITLLLTLFGSALFAEETPDGPPSFYGFCVDVPTTANLTISQQAEMLHELGYDGVGYPLWFGENLDQNLKIVDDAELELCLLYLPVNIDPAQPAYDSRVPESFAKLKGRPVTISVLLGGFPPGDPRGMEPAVKILRELGDLAAESDLKISIYHHLNDWSESLLFSLDVVKAVDHPNVGVNFNLCHWLKVDGDIFDVDATVQGRAGIQGRTTSNGRIGVKKDYRTMLRENADRIFAVTINGAQCDATEWTGGLIQPLDRGDFDNEELMGVLQEIGYTGPIGLMCFGIPDEPREHLERSMKVWNSWWEE